MGNDFEILYMIRQECRFAYQVIMDNFNRLLWKRSHDFYLMQKPIGISVNDLYQEGSIGMYESLYSYQESKEVGFAFYLNLCVISNMKTLLRKCRGQSYRLLDSKASLDMAIAEDDSLVLGDVLEDESLTYNPSFQAEYLEAKDILNKVLSEVSVEERQVYQLRHLGFSYNEIAKATKFNNKNIDNIVQKIRRKLKQYQPFGT